MTIGYMLDMLVASKVWTSAKDFRSSRVVISEMENGEMFSENNVSPFSYASSIKYMSGPTIEPRLPLPHPFSRSICLFLAVSSPSYTGLTTRLRPTSDRIFLESWANRRMNVRLVADVGGDCQGKIS